MAGKHWTQEEEFKLKEFVSLKKYSFRQMAKFFPGRTPGGLQGHSRRVLNLDNEYIHHLYTHDKNFFKIPNYINSYFSGWLAADGSLTKSESALNYTLNWEMHAEDIKFLELFKEYIKYTGPIALHNDKSPCSENISPHATLKINQINLDDFSIGKNFGVIPQKTYRLPPPNLNDIELKLAYIVGYINGDGCIAYTSETGGIVIRFTSSSPYILNWLKELIDSLGLPQRRKKSSNVNKMSHANCNELGYNGLRAIYLFELLSLCPVPCLDRKWKNPKILDYISRKKSSNPNWFTESIDSILQRNNINFSKVF